MQLRIGRRWLTERFCSRSQSVVQQVSRRSKLTARRLVITFVPTMDGKRAEAIDRSVRALRPRFSGAFLHRDVRRGGSLRRQVNGLWGCEMKWTVAAMMAGAVVLTAPVAHADTGDAQFLSLIHEHIFGLTADGGDPELIKLGHAVCDQLAVDDGDRDLIHQKLANHWKSESDAAWFITASAVAYCPEFILPSDRW